MAGTPFINDLGQYAIENAISSTHFGVNYVAGVNTLETGSNFSKLLQHLGSSAVRYPGGTVTERYFDPQGDIWQDLFERGETEVQGPDGNLIEGPGRLFEYASSNDLGIQFVLPTMNLVSTKSGKISVSKDSVAKVEQLVSDVLSGRFGEVNIQHFEIGNEYYHFADLNAEEYGKAADALIRAVDGAIQDHASRAALPSDWVAPKIAVQAGAGWREGDNDTIISTLSQDALDAIDSVVIHYYAPNLEEVDGRDRHLGQIDDWEDAVGNRSLDYFASEWNIYGADGADSGMAQASALISGFETLLAAGVDTASIWGAQFRWLDAGLSSNFGDAELSETKMRLSVAGEIVASMEESLIGLRAFIAQDSELITSAKLDNDFVDPSEDTYVVNTFGSDERAVIYISSRSDQTLLLQLQVGDYFGKYTHIWGETLTSVDDPASEWKDESDPTVVHGLPKFELLSERDLSSGEVVIPPHGILRLSVQLSEDGVTISDHDPMYRSGINYDDELFGSKFDDRMTSHVGDDVLFGREGSDSIRGGDDHDFIYGGGGQDAAYGDKGNDSIFGAEGNDQIVGGDGIDYLAGGDGADVINGGNGNDRLFGGRGDDILSGGRGFDELRGGSGADYFVAPAGSHGHISDFDLSEGDQITFLGQFDDPQSLLNSMTTTGDDNGDLIISFEDGSKTLMIGMGAEKSEFIESVVDFQESGMSALDLSEQLNEMSRNQIRSLFDEMDSETFDSTFGASDPIILFANLDAKTAGQVLDSMDPTDLEELFGETGAEGFLIGLSEYSPTEVAALFDQTSADTAQQIVSYTGEQSAKSLLDGMELDDRDRLEPKLLGQKVEERGHSLEDYPTVDAEAPSIDETTDKDEGDILMEADCFVATVAYADGDHPEVWLLRWYRDSILRSSLFGRMLIVLYWAIGPRLAEAVHGKRVITALVRKIVAAIVQLIGWYYERSPGRQADHPIVIENSRLIRLRRK